MLGPAAQCTRTRAQWLPASRQREGWHGKTSCGPACRLRIRERLAVRHARGDRIERRYLTRLELIFARRRFRLDFRTSNWAAWAIRALGTVVPHGWRGNAQERGLSREVVALVEEATRQASVDPERWEAVMLKLNMQAEMGRLRSMRPADLRKLIAQ